MGGQRPSGKPFAIEKMEVQRAWEKVRANKGAPGVDAVSLADFEKDLKDNLYKVWNRMSSGSYFPPPVKAVEIPKAGGGTRVLGVPSIGDRVAQTVVAARIEAVAEPVFHGDSYGYRPGRSEVPQIFRTGDRIGSSPERNGIECRVREADTLLNLRSRQPGKWLITRCLSSRSRGNSGSMSPPSDSG